MSTRIEDYALIGDCETAALVGRDGSIDWLCLPRFDSQACLAALLGDETNGRWKIAPSGAVIGSQRAYRDDTLILETTFRAASGVAVLRDFMPLRDGASNIIRIVEGLEGTLAFDFEFMARFDYGQTVPWMTFEEDGVVTAIAGPDMLILHSDVPLTGDDRRVTSSFTVRKRERLTFVLTSCASYLPRPKRVDPETALQETERFWREFTERCPDVDGWTGPVKRSLITLKALTYMPTGGIVAAVTTSLPEKLGGTRNWDYRYCWLRDATLTLLALMKLGYYEEASAWRSWLLRAVAGAPEQMQIMYGVAGERNLREWDADWLPGYEGSKPVRIGNAASEQFQLDVYGEVADALMQAAKGGLPPHPRGQEIGRVLMPFLERVWRDPDEGIWEVRGARQHFTYSKVMAWVAFIRVALMADEMGDQETARRWRKVADEIHAEVCAKAFDPTLNSFVQAYGSTALDASVLQIGMVGFLPPDDPRYVGTVEAIERHLTHEGFVLRYRTGDTDDGLPSDEGVFLACSFWLADALNLIGRRDDARTLFERLLALSNDVGLLSEEYDPVEKRMLGNFPQAFSHIGIINTALNLTRHKGPADERSDASPAATRDRGA
ncbi:glycosyl hydrolase [Rhizobium sp. Leaf384]|uniref:glycoside hydrolase family 15 protein n=1 Tax=unclassified Rhizobium TaxID=2613769 RepID=UPI00071398BC|nr:MULTISPECIES: glycoside hydrolase family 15 protein [unclassified Rhizobium]KQS75597.1 glycosyl hydrolase [Rhizobium sp. Leaf384]KQS75846.1 glycosyl hydrolase [Rhizobium sp. Leaf383]